MKRVVIIGGGFAGVWAALAASRTRTRHANRGDVSITVVSRDAFLTIRPRLYEAALDDVRVPLDEVLAPIGVERVEATVARIDTSARTVSTDDGRTLRYDRLVLAAGSRMHRAAIAGAGHAHAVDTYDEALALARHLESLADDARVTAADGRFAAVVVGAGFTGIEVATTLIARLRKQAARASAAGARLFLVERGAVLAPDLGADARAHVMRAIASLGIEPRTGVEVATIDPLGVTLSSGERIDAATVVLTGGLRAPALASQLPVERDGLGRVAVDESLRVIGIDDVFAAGDVARAVADPDGARIAPMSCQCATPMGEVAGANAVAELVDAPPVTFSHRHYVTCLDLGEAGALFMQGWDRAVRLTGFWGGQMKQAINTRLIYPPRLTTASRPGRGTRNAA